MLTKTDIRGICALPPTTLQRWVEAGVVEPADRGGVGRGHAHGFTTTQAVALAVVAGLQRGGRPCALSFAAKVVAVLGAMTEDELLGELDRGRTLLLPDDSPRLIEPESWRTTREEFNVQAAHARVAKYLDRMGRRRPLAGTKVE